MPMVLPFIAAAVASASAAVAAAGSAIAVTAGALAAGDLALAGAGLMALGDTVLVGTVTLGQVAMLGALAGVSALLAPHPKVNTAGSPQQFKSDPNAAIPWVEGRYGVGGNLVYETTSGGSNKAAAGAQGNEYLTQFVILSAGPIQAIESLRFNDTILTFSGQSCTGGFIPEAEVQSYNPGYKTQNSDGSWQNNTYSNHAWQNTQLGALNAGHFAYPDKLNTESDAPLPEWTSAHGFSGLAAAALTIVYDQTVYAAGVPQPQWTIQGGLRYDPRKDSTFPGGAGPHRWAGAGASAASIAGAWGSWSYNTNPIIAALNYALGYYRTDPATGLGRLYGGMGAGVIGVDVAAFVRAANIADTNGWLICGQWTTDDGKWSVLTEMLKAGSATPVIDRGIISCIVDTPLTSLGTITADDLSGPIKLPTGSSFTARLNTIFPRYSSEAHRWQMVQVDAPVKAATYVAEDGAVRSKTMDWQYVPAVNQVCQLTAYAITNGREIAGIELPGKPKLRNYTVGDCLTVDIPEAGLATTKVMVTKRTSDPMTGGVTLTVRTETDAKHAYSLGRTGVAPATPGISGYDPSIVQAPLPDFWATGAIEITDPATGESRSLIRVTGSAADNVYAQDLLVRWRLVSEVNGNWTPVGAGAWSYRSFPASQGQFDLDLNPGAYDVQIAYIAIGGAYPSADEDWLDLGIETVGGTTAWNAANLGGLSATQIAIQLGALSPIADTSTPATMGAPTVASSTTLDATGNPTTTLSASASASSSGNIAGYEFSFTLGAAAAIIYPTVSPAFSWQVPAGASYSVMVRAVKLSGVRGAWSTAATGATAKDAIAPGAPINLAAIGGLGANFLSWTNPAATDLDHVEVWASTTNTQPNPATQSALMIGVVAAAPNITGSYSHSGLTTSQAWYYWVRAVDTSGNASGFNAVAGVSATARTLTQADLTQGLTVPLTVNASSMASIAGSTASPLAFNKYDGQLYRYVSGSPPSAVWTTAVPTASLTGTVTSSQIAAGAVTSLQLSSGSVGLSAFASGLQPIQTVSSLPVSGSAGQVVYLSTDGNLYRYTSGAWTAALAAGNISGTLGAGQIASVYASTVSGQLAAVNIPGLDASKVISGTLPSAVTVPAANLSGAISAANIPAVNASAILAGALPSGVTLPAASVSGTLTAAQIGAVNASVVSGQLAAVNIPGLDASKVISGTLPSAVTVPAASVSGTLTAAQIGAVNASVVSGQLAAVNIPGVDASKVISGTFGSAFLAAGAVGTAQIAAGAVVASSIAAGTIVASNIAAGTITGTLIAAGTISGSNITAGTITASNITAGTITAAQIAAGTIVASNIAAGTITGSLIAAATISGSNIVAGTLTSAQISAGSITATSLAVTGDNLLRDSFFTAAALWGNASITNGANGYSLIGYGSGLALGSGAGNGWYINAAADNADFGATGGITLYNASGYTPNGLNKVRYQQTIAWSGAAATMGKSGLAPITGNTVYELGALFEDNGTTDSCSLLVNLYDVNANLLLGVSLSSSGGSHGFKTTQFTSPATAAWAVPVIFNGGGVAWPASTFMRIGALSLRQANAATMIVNGSITATQIAVGTIVAANIAAGTITGTLIAAGTISATNIAAGTITGSLIAGGTITGNLIQAGAISASNIAAGAITASKLYIGDTSNQVTNSIFAGGSADGWGLGAGAVIHPGSSNDASQYSAYIPQLTYNSVSTFNTTFGVLVGDQYYVECWAYCGVTAGALQLGLLVSNASVAGTYNYVMPAVGTVNGGGWQLISGIVTIPSTTYVNGSSNTYQATAAQFCVLTPLASSPAGGWYFTKAVVRKAVTGSLIVNGTIQAANIAAGTITGNLIQAGAITAAQIAAGTITAAQIAAGTITGSLIAANTIVGGNIAGNSITGDRIQVGTLTADRIASNSITASQIAAGTITTTNISATANITGTQIAAGTIVAANISVGSLSALSANLGTVTAGLIQNAAGSVYFNVSNGQIVRSAGGYYLVDGAGFGANSDLIMWFGPTSIAIGSMTKTNGSWSMGTNGVITYGSQTLGASGAASQIGKSGSLGAPSGSYGGGISASFAKIPGPGFLNLSASFYGGTGNPYSTGTGAASGNWQIIAQNSSGTQTVVAGGTWSSSAYISGEGVLTTTMNGASNVSVACPYTGLVTIILEMETTSDSRTCTWTASFTAQFVSQG